MMQRCSTAPVIVCRSFLTFDRLRLPGRQRQQRTELYSRIASFRFFSDDHHSTANDISVIHYLHGRAWPKVKPRRGEENDQTNDTGRNRISPAKLREICSNLGAGHLGWGRARPVSTAEHSRRSRARQGDDEIVRFRGPIADLGKSINKWRWDAHSVEGCMSVHGAIERRVHR